MGDQLGGVLGGLAAVITATIGGVAVIVGLLRRTPTEPSSQADADDLITQALLERDEAALAAADESRKALIDRLYQLERAMFDHVCTQPGQQGVRIPPWPGRP